MVTICVKLSKLSLFLYKIDTLRHILSPCERSEQGANLTERKNPHTPVYGFKEFVCLSVCLSVRLSFCLSVVFYRILFDLTRTKNNVKKFATLAARAVFVSSFFLQKQLIYAFWQEIITRTCPICWGVMKFATHISPLLNSLHINMFFNDNKLHLNTQQFQSFSHHT